VVFFYPKANTPGCTAEACDLRDNFDRFQANNYELLGVSADAARLKPSSKTNNPFPLLADEDKSVIEALAFGDLKNLWEKNMMVFTEPLL
jgi:peroxiredoxin Q/BCP